MRVLRLTMLSFTLLTLVKMLDSAKAFKGNPLDEGDSQFLVGLQANLNEAMSIVLRNTGRSV